MTHKKIQLQNIQEKIMSMNIKIKFEFLVVCFQFGIENKGKKYLEKICQIIQSMDFICFELFDELVGRLGMTNQRRESLKEIWGLVDQNIIDQDEENNYEFEVRIKDWFKKYDTDTMTEP